MSVRTADQIDWSFRQVFGDTCSIESIQEADMISAIKFNQDGSFLAAGDRGGRVIVFERTRPASSAGSPAPTPVEYSFYAEFQSHEPEFDSLRSVQISERIVQVQWLPPSGGALFLLTTNERTFKVWKLYNKVATQVTGLNVGRQGVSRFNGELVVPRVLYGKEPNVTSTVLRVYSNATTFHINAVAPSSAGDDFLVSDDLRINIWSLHRKDEAMNVVDLKPPNLEDVQEVITYADAHPFNASLFLYGTSHGVVRLCDTRKRALCDSLCKQYTNPMISSSDTPYAAFGSFSGQADIAAGISGAHMTRDGTFIVARDFLSLKIWDVRFEGKPLFSIPIHPYVKDYAQRLLESDSLFDRNDVAISPDGRSFLTGSYSDRFHIYGSRGRDLQHTSGIAVMATRQIRRRSKQVLQHLGGKAIPSAGVGALPVLENGRVLNENLSLDAVDIRKKIQFLDWHPSENILAIATVANLYVYAGP